MNWISVKDKLPEINQNVMVFIDRNHINHNPIDFAFCTYTKYGFSLSRVTHWKPLPEPPKEEKEEG